ncbi:sulfite:cytochrome C oxidoreductase subunit B [Sulfurovum sp.]|uniref:sulfite:cytochrome C oxidoreductase subunit B n=1 Tax=Sulfurovum sp. TaxID=1969726 RepID=UPI002867EF0A|nr:sulfite:cytochrome C oxidoreductase subunit B [Sulfurovum sp.]
MKKLLIATLIASPLFSQVKENIEVPYVPFPIKMGKGFDAIQANCLTCHSFGYITNQGRQSKAFWHEKVKKMIIHFKAPMDEAAVTTTTDYLFEYYGNGKLK